MVEQRYHQEGKHDDIHVFFNALAHLLKAFVFHPMDDGIFFTSLNFFFVFSTTQEHQWLWWTPEELLFIFLFAIHVHGRIVCTFMASLVCQADVTVKQSHFTMLASSLTFVHDFSIFGV